VKAGINMDDLELEFIEAGAEDIEVEDDMITVTTALEDFGKFNKKLEELGIEPQKAELQRIPTVDKRLPVAEAKLALRMIDELEDNEDVQNVYHNLEMTDELEKALEEE